MNQVRTFSRRATVALGMISGLACGLSASGPLRAQTTVTTDWNRTIGTVSPNLVGVNLWLGMNPAIAKSNANYRAGLANMSPTFLRYHAAEQLGTTGQGWLNGNGDWVSSRVLDSVLSTKDYGQTRMVTITRWPDKWRYSGTDRLDPSRVTDYANWCGQLVTLLKNNNAGVTYYEPFNEVEGLYGGNLAGLAQIFLAARTAMKNADPNAQIGAPVFRNPWQYQEFSDFLNAVGTNIDFVSYHHYASNNAGESVPVIYDQTMWPGGIANRAAEIRYDMRVRGITGPLFITEQNMFYSYTQDTSRRLMKTSRAAVFDALLLKGLAEAGDVDAAPSWNDADYTYGKLSNANDTYGLRPAAHFMRLARQNLVGRIAATSTTADKTVQGFAVTSGTKYALALINRTENPQTVNLAFANNWAPSGNGYTRHEISDANTDGDSVGGYNPSAQNWSGAPQNLAMPANSVWILVWNGTSQSAGSQPFGGTARPIPGRIQAEDFDSGGQGVGYLDSTWGNSGGQYRAERVDITTTNDAGGGYAVYNPEAGEWLQYTVNVAPGTYTLKLRASSYWGSGSDAITVKLNGTVLRTSGVSQTWNDDGFTDMTFTGVNIPTSLAGTGKTLRLEFAYGGFRVNWVDFALTGIPDGTYRLTYRHSGKVVDVSGQSTGDDATIIQWPYNGGNNQRWTLTNLGGNAYKIVNVNSGKALEVPPGAGNGVQCRQRAYTGTDNQKWRLLPTSTSYFKLQNVATNLMMDVQGANSTDGNPVILWPDNGGTNQQLLVGIP